MVEGLCPEETKRRLKRDPSIRLKMQHLGEEALVRVITDPTVSYRAIMESLTKIRDGYIRGYFDEDAGKSYFKKEKA